VNRNALLSRDERALLARMPEHVEPGVRILANPRTGADFGYFLTGLDIFPAKYQLPRSPAYQLLMTQLQFATENPEVCDAVRALRAHYVLDFGADWVPPWDATALPGFTGFEGVPGFELVDRQGAASLWRITACGS